MKKATRTIWNLETIGIGLVLGLNVGFVMNLLEVHFTGFATLFVAILLLVEFIISSCNHQKVWSYVNNLFLAVLLGICVVEFYNPSALGVVLMDIIAISMVIAIVCIYKMIKYNKKMREEKLAEEEAAEKKRKDEEEAKERKENTKVYNWAEEPENDDADDIQPTDYPEPEVVQNIVRNLTSESDPNVF